MRPIIYSNLLIIYFMVSIIYNIILFWNTFDDTQGQYLPDQVCWGGRKVSLSLTLTFENVKMIHLVITNKPYSSLRYSLNPIFVALRTCANLGVAEIFSFTYNELYWVVLQAWKSSNPQRPQNWNKSKSTKTWASLL